MDRGLGGFGPAGLLAALVIVLAGNVAAGGVAVLPLGALLALAWARLSGTPWRDLGYVRPKSWLRTVVIGVLFGVLFKFAMKSLVMPLLGADPINRTYHFLAGNTAVLPAAIWSSLVAGFGEETVFRGFLFERLGRLAGSGPRAKAAIVIVTSVLFGLAHFPDQGLAGAEQAVITGLTFGTIYVATGSLALPMIAHASFDVAAVLMIYWEREREVAHLFWK